VGGSPAEMIPTTETLISSAGFPLVGGGAIGFGVGYLLKKLIKLAFIAFGLIALLLGCMCSQNTFDCICRSEYALK
jgi:uncharacterized membrane protein (Fun14 family)